MSVLLKKPKKNKDMEAISKEVKNTKNKKKTEEKVEEKKLMLLKAKIDKKKGVEYISFLNLDDLPRQQKEAVKFYDGKKLTDKNKENLGKAMKAVGLTFSSKKGYDPAELEHNRKKESNLPKFEARTFEFDDEDYIADGDGKFIELGPNFKPKANTPYVIIQEIEKGKGKKKRIETVLKLIELTWIGKNCCHFADPETEDAIIGNLDMLEDRVYYETDEDGDPVDDERYEMVPVKRPKKDKDDEDDEDYEDDDEDEEEDE